MSLISPTFDVDRGPSSPLVVADDDEAEEDWSPFVASVEEDEEDEDEDEEDVEEEESGPSPESSQR